MMNARAKWIAGLVVAAMLPMAAHADDASKRAKLHVMFQLAHIDRTMQAAFSVQEKQLPQLMRKLMPGQTLSPEQQADLDAFVVKVHGIVAQAASWDKLEPQFTDIYAAVYTEGEVDGLIAFYRSPVGAEMVARQPEILERSQAVTQSLITAVQPQVMQAAMEFAQQMQAKYGAGKTSAAPAAPAPGK